MHRRREQRDAASARGQVAGLGGLRGGAGPAWAGAGGLRGPDGVAGDGSPLVEVTPPTSGKGSLTCMAQHNQSDDVSRAVRRWSASCSGPGAGHQPGRISAAAGKAAGLSAAQAQRFLNGLITLPPRQTVAFVGAVLEQQRAQAASRYALATRTPTQPREPSEASLEGAQAAWSGWASVAGLVVLLRRRWDVREGRGQARVVGTPPGPPRRQRRERPRAGGQAGGAGRRRRPRTSGTAAACSAGV